MQRVVAVAQVDLLSVRRHARPLLCGVPLADTVVVAIPVATARV